MALLVWHRHLAQPRRTDGRTDAMKGSYLGPGFTPEQIQASEDPVVKGFIEGRPELMESGR